MRKDRSKDARKILSICSFIFADWYYPPYKSISELVKAIKGRSSRKIQVEFPELSKRCWGKHFWAIGYAAFIAREVTDAIIKDTLGIIAMMMGILQLQIKDKK